MDSELVLDVGSGHRPLPQADVLADRFVDNQERSDDLVIDRPLVLADIEHLPFKNDAFEFANASQVVEHVDDPQQAIAELERVATSGQADTPAYVSENVLFGRDFHKWTMLVPSLSGDPIFLPATHPERDWFKSIFSSFAAFNYLLWGLDALLRINICRYYWGEGLRLHRKMRFENADSRLSKLIVYIDTTIGEIGQMVTNRLSLALKDSD